MKKLLLAIPFAILVGCGGEPPTPENFCCMEKDCNNLFAYTTALEKVSCLYIMAKELEKKNAILDTLLKYRCAGESK